MIFFEIKNPRGEILISNFLKATYVIATDLNQKEKEQESAIKGIFVKDDVKFDLEKNFTTKIGTKKVKSVFHKDKDFGSISLVVIEDEKDQDILKSSKLLKKLTTLVKVLAQKLYKENQLKYDLQTHTLKTVHAQISQELDNFTQEKNFHGETHSQIVDKITQEVISNPKLAAEFICYIKKRAVSMNAQLLSLDIIYFESDVPITLEKISIKRAIYSQFVAFLEKFNELGIYLSMYIDNESHAVLDKDLFSLIMYNFFENATKYMKKNAEIKINYNSTTKTLDISMMSLKMEKNELENIRKNGVRSKNAIGYCKGRGVGLFIINKSLALMSKNEMYIKPRYKTQEKVDDMFFVENHFRFVF